MNIVTGRSVDADSTVMPQLLSWVDRMIDESPKCNAADDHCVCLFLNLPSCGVISSAKWDYVISLVANTMNRYKRNGLAILVHPNRASQKSRRVLHPLLITSAQMKV